MLLYDRSLVRPRSAPFRSALAERVAEDLLDWMIMARLTVQDPANALLRRAFRTATGDAGFELGTGEQFRKALLKKRAAVAESLKERLEGTRPALTVETWTSSSAVSASRRLGLGLGRHAAGAMPRVGASWLRAVVS